MRSANAACRSRSPPATARDTIRASRTRRCWASPSARNGWKPCSEATATTAEGRLLSRLLQVLVQDADRRVAVDPLDGGDFAGHPVERRFVELALGIGLFRLAFGAVQVAHHLGDRDQVAGV